MKAILRPKVEPLYLLILFVLGGKGRQAQLENNLLNRKILVDAYGKLDLMGVRRARLQNDLSKWRGLDQWRVTVKNNQHQF